MSFAQSRHPIQQWLSVGVLVIAGTACGASQPAAPSVSGSASANRSAPAPLLDAENVKRELSGRTFTSIAITGRDLVPDTAITVAFGPSGLSAQANCNAFSGSYTGDAQLIVENLSQTELGCSADLMAQDVWLAQFLTSNPSLSLEGPVLALSRDGVQLTLSDEPPASTPRASLVNTAWRLISAQRSEGTGPNAAISSVAVPAGSAQASVRFFSGQVRISTGCNYAQATVTGNLSAAAGSFTLGDYTTTLRGCAQGEPLERAFSVVMDGEVSYVIEGRELQLGKPDGSSLTFQALNRPR